MKSGVLIALLALSGTVAAEMKPFDIDSMDAIKRERSGVPFVLLLWSIDCPPCREELAMVPRWQRAYSGLQFVIVSTDGLALEAEAASALARTGVVADETWIFADEFVERLRYRIDPRWRGELPRSYFFDSHHRAHARSGPISDEWLAYQVAAPLTAE